MTPEKRLYAYDEAAQECKTTGQQKLRSEDGLSAEFCPLGYSTSLRLPEAGVSDLLHNWKINVPAWVLSLWWMNLNKQGREQLVRILREKGARAHNYIIQRLFQSKSKGLYGDDFKLISDKLTISEVKKRVKIQGADFDQLVPLLDEIVATTNKEENYSDEIRKSITEVSQREFSKLEQMASKHNNSRTQIRGAGRGSITSTPGNSSLPTNNAGGGQIINRSLSVDKTVMEQNPTTCFGILFQRMIKIYFLLNSKDPNTTLVEEIIHHSKIFFHVLSKFFPGKLNKPSIHDSMHMIFDQLLNVIPPSLCNTSKTEALNKGMTTILFDFFFF